VVDTYASFPFALSQRKTKMPLQGMRKNIRKTHHPNRQKHHTTTIILRMPTLHVKTRHNHRQHENSRRETSRIPQSVRVTSKMRPLLQPTKRATTRRAPTRRMPPLPKSPPMQPTQKIRQLQPEVFLCASSLCYCFSRVSHVLSGKRFMHNGTIHVYAVAEGVSG
jgi:hypothetical protein